MLKEQPQGLTQKIDRTRTRKEILQRERQTSRETSKLIILLILNCVVGVLIWYLYRGNITF